MSDEIYARLKTKLVFDPLDFDQELIELPLLIMECAEETAARISDRDKAKNKLDLAMAEAADELRCDATTDAKGNPKIRSEAQISSEVPLYKTVQEALTALENAKYDLAIWQALMDALRTKRDAMKIYSELTNSGYLSPQSAIDNRRAEIRAASVNRRRPV